MMNHQICIVLVLCISGCLCVSVFPPIDSPTTSNPCALRFCPRGTVCRLQQVFCVRPPCFTVSVCIEPRPTNNVCAIMSPILDANLREIVCKSDARCPAGTYCNQRRYGRGFCCLQDVVAGPIEKPGSCPVVNNIRNSQLRCGRPCSFDNDCSGSNKCCESGGCGKVCRRPVNGLPICPIWNPNCNNRPSY